MKKKLLFISLALGFGILFQSCHDDSNNNEIIDDEDEKEYTLPAPELVISTPVPCINEDVGFSFKSDLNVEPVWDFGDKTTSSEKTAEHSYSEEGTFTVNLKLSDGQGGTVSVDTTISVMGKRLNDALEDLINDPSKKWICAHRANTYYGKKMGNIPENSVGAIEQAIKTGAEMIEIDVQTTSDGALVVMHNDNIDETTNGTGAIAEMTLERLRSFYLTDQDGDLTSYKVPTLEEALLAGRGKIYYDLDLKDTDPTPVIGLVDSLHMLDRVAFYRGSSKSKAQEITDVNSQCIVFPYVKSTSVIDYWAENPRIRMVQLDYTDLTAGDIVAAAKAKGMVSFANYLNDPGEAILNSDYSALDKIIELQFHIIQTDYAEYVKAHIE